MKKYNLLLLETTQIPVNIHLYITYWTDGDKLTKSLINFHFLCNTLTMSTFWIGNAILFFTIFGFALRPAQIFIEMQSSKVYPIKKT